MVELVERRWSKRENEVEELRDITRPIGWSSFRPTSATRTEAIQFGIFADANMLAYRVDISICSNSLDRTEWNWASHIGRRSPW
jgi:hypothetical protein